MHGLASLTRSDLRMLHRLVSAVAVLALVTPASAQTPEQRYGDWAEDLFPAQEYAARRATLLDGLASTGGGLLLVPSADGVTHGETFRQLDDFWHLTGLELPASMLVLDGDRGSAVLFLPGRDARFENPGRRNDFPGRPLGDDPDVRARAGVATADVASLGDSLTAWVDRGHTLRVNAGRGGAALDAGADLVGRLDPVETLVLRLRRDHPEVDLANAFAPMARLRMRKSPAEVQAMRRAANATAAAIRESARFIESGVDEATLRGVFEATCRREGSERIPFTPIVKSGPNSLWAWRILASHNDRRNRVMRDGDLVILDVGCEVGGYVSDVGRTFPVSGTFSDAQKEKLAVSTTAADAIIAAVRPGVTLAELTRIAYEAIPDHEEQYMQTPSYFGHHIGMSSGDPALMDEPLTPGMVFTVEPWYYNHDEGISVFVEDVVLVTENGVEVLTRALPRSPAELERMVR